MNPIVIVTRVGIGIYDRAWWTPRLALFKAITLPSLARFRELNIHWTILLDTEIPNDVYTEIRDAVEAVDADFVNFSFVENHAFTRSAIRDAFRAQASPNERIIAMMIDDDDAVGADFFENAFTVINEDPDRSQVISMSRGAALDAPSKEISELYYKSNTCNTVFYGTADEILKVIFGSHTEWLDIAERAGLRGIENDKPTRQFSYTYHQQGDGSYELRVSSLDAWEQVTPEDLEWFGIDHTRFNEWRTIQKDAPETFGLTWRRTQAEQFKFSELYLEMRNVKQGAIQTNSNLFDPQTPFIYILYPLQPDRRKAGSISFQGVATPGAKVEMYVTGKSGEFQLMGSSIANASTGSFGIRARLNAGQWTTAFKLYGQDDQVVKELNYMVTVVPAK